VENSLNQSDTVIINREVRKEDDELFAKRRRVFLELIETEENYVKDLRMIEKVFNHFNFNIPKQENEERKESVCVCVYVCMYVRVCVLSIQESITFYSFI
jgi:hypothetical protein